MCCFLRVLDLNSFRQMSCKWSTSAYFSSSSTRVPVCNWLFFLSFSWQTLGTDLGTVWNVEICKNPQFCWHQTFVGRPGEELFGEPSGSEIQICLFRSREATRDKLSSYFGLFLYISGIVFRLKFLLCVQNGRFGRTLSSFSDTKHQNAQDKKKVCAVLAVTVVSFISPRI